MAIQFFNNDVSLQLRDRKKLKEQILQIFDLEGSTLSSLTYVFCSDKFLLSINQQFLQHEDYTDIITFNLSDPGNPISGEIYISIERVKENAEILGISLQEELHRVIFHGALHLCGYTDKEVRQKRKMTTAENKYLKLYFR